MKTKQAFKRRYTPPKRSGSSREKAIWARIKNDKEQTVTHGGGH